MSRRATRSANAPVAVQYRIDASDLHAHLFHVTLTIAHPQAEQVLTLPVWIAGSYLVREFARHVQNLRASQGRKACPIHQRDKATWCVQADPSRPLEVRYAVYAFDPSVRAAWLDSQRGFFNGTSLCLQVAGQTKQVHHLTLDPIPSRRTWQVATGLTPLACDRNGWGRYAAQDYDELVDCPFTFGALWSGHFEAAGIPHRFVVTGAPPSFDGTRLLADTQKICEAALAFWHGSGKQGARKAPHAHYVFMLHATDEGYGGLEHRNSTALICNRRDLPRVNDSGPIRDNYVTLLGLISHEYFHTWNVKRLRPDTFAHYDYSQENYTDLLWFFEGFTSYYDDLLLLRSGLIDTAQYLRLLNQTITTIQHTPGRRVQSVAQASFDAWIKYYRVDENTPNATVSYYAKGALVAVCLDLSLRQEGTSLDALMRHLWRQHKGGPISEQAIRDGLHAISGRSYHRELQAWVHGTDELPVAKALASQGIEIDTESAPFDQRLGVRVSDVAGSVRIKTVLRDSAAERAGLAAHDEWLGLEVGPRRSPTMWRISKLDEVPMLMGRLREGVMWVARDRQLLRLPFQLPAAASVWRLRLAPTRARTMRWPLA